MPNTKKIVLVVTSIETAVGRIASDLQNAFRNSDEFEVCILERMSFREHFWATCVLLANADVIHYLDSRMYFDFSMRALEAKSVSTIHHISPGEDWKLYCTRAKFVVVTDRFTEQKVRDRAETCYRLGTGIRESQFTSISESRRQGVRSAFGLGDSEFVVGTLSKASRANKDKDLIAKVIEALVHKETNVSFLLAGSGWGTEFESANTQLIRHRMDDHELVDFYSALDVFLCHSTVEGGPLPVIEALACGTPVISTDVGQVSEWFERVPEAGRIVPNEVEKIIEAFSAVRDESEEARRIRSEATRCAFGYQVIALQYRDLWQQVAAKSVGCSGPRFPSPAARVATGLLIRISARRMFS